MVWMKSAVILLLGFVCLSSATLLRSKEHLKNRQSVLMFLDVMEKGIMRDIKTFTETGYKSPMLELFIKMTPYDSTMAIKEVDDYLPDQAIIGCLACRTYLAVIIRDRLNGATEQELIESATNICGIVTPFGETVCRGLVVLNVESLVFIIDSRPTLTATQICSLVLQGECGAVDPMFAFNVNVSPGQPINQPKSVFTPRSPDDLKIIHLTDMHYDPHYLEGSVAGGCINPVCCRRGDGPAPIPSDGAGFWGDYRTCDTPWRSIEDTLRRVRAAHPDADYIYHTGDIVDHGVWETTEAGNRAIMDRVFNMFREVFGNTPVFHAIGNHEAQPTNVFAPPHITRPSLSASWLYNYLADTWQRHGWISGDAVNTVRATGYFTMLVRPGFRVISMNNNDCYIYNWWLLYSRAEAQSNLQWLHNTLLAAEANHERVHILKHLPSGGGSCQKFWSREYRRIIDRFHMIIGAQFNGHSHMDEFEVYYDSATAQHAINVAWNGGGATAFVALNPNYHQYFVDRVHYQVTESESYIFSVSEANATPHLAPRWFRQYAFAEAFGMQNLSPASLNTLVFDMSRNRNILRRYWEFKVKQADPYIQEGCDDDCLRSAVCSIVTNEHDEPRRCNQVLAVFGQIA